MCLDAPAAGRAAFIAGEFAERVVFDEGLEAAELSLRTLPAPSLPDALVFADSIHQHPTFGKPPRERLFTINVHTGVRGIDADPRVPVIGGGNADGIESGNLQKIGVVREGLAVRVSVMPVHPALCAGKSIGIQIANGHDANALDIEEIRHIPHAHRAAADDAHGDFVIGGALLCPEPGHRGKAEGRNTAGEEFATRNRIACGFHKVAGDTITKDRNLSSLNDRKQETAQLSRASVPSRRDRPA